MSTDGLGTFDRHLDELGRHSRREGKMLGGETKDASRGGGNEEVGEFLQLRVSFAFSLSRVMRYLTD